MDGTILSYTRGQVNASRLLRPLHNILHIPMLGITLSDEGQRVEAIAQPEKALMLKPDFPAALDRGEQ